MAARRNELAERVIYVRNSECAYAHEAPMYVVTFYDNVRARFSNYDDAVDFMYRVNGTDILCFPSLERVKNALL